MTIHSVFGRSLLTVQARPSATDALRPVTIDLAQLVSMDFVQHSLEGPMQVYIQTAIGVTYCAIGSEAEELARHFNPAYSVEQRLVELRGQIEYHKYRYHTLNDPIISDFNYDALVQELRTLEAQAAAQGPSPAALVSAKEQLLDTACDLVLLQKALHKLIAAMRGHTSDAAARDEALRRLQSARAGLEEAGSTLGLGSLYRASEDAVERAGAESAQDADLDISAHHPWDEPF